MRIDRLLYFLRFSRSRTAAQGWIGEGHIRKNRERVLRNDLSVQPGDVLTLPLRRDVLAIEILELPARRGPAAEARSCYRVLDAGRPFDIAGIAPGSIKGARQAEGTAPK